MDKLKHAAQAFQDKVGPTDDMAPPIGQERAKNTPVHPSDPHEQLRSSSAAAGSSSGTVFDQDKVKVVYVLGAAELGPSGADVARRTRRRCASCAVELD